MLKWTGSNKIQVGCDWFETGSNFTSLYLDEIIGGKFPSGRIKLISSGSDKFLDKVLNSKDINITLGDSEVGIVLDIHGVITHREYYDSCATIDFESIPDADFYKKRNQMTWEQPIDDVIKSLWHGRKTDIRTQSDVSSGLKFIQSNEYDCEFLGTLCTSYKKDSIFALGLDGLLIKDLIGTDSTGHKEPYWIITSKGDTMVSADKGVSGENYHLNYDKKLYLEPEDISISNYFDTRLFDNEYKWIKKDYTTLRENYINNKKIYDSVMYNQITLVKNDFLATTYRLGDTVKYLIPGKDETKVPWEIYLISRIQYYVNTEPDNESDGVPFKQVYTLHCLQEKGATMPGVGSDPMDS